MYNIVWKQVQTDRSGDMKRSSLVHSEIFQTRGGNKNFICFRGGYNLRGGNNGPEKEDNPIKGRRRQEHTRWWHGGWKWQEHSKGESSI